MARILVFSRERVREIQETLFEDELMVVHDVNSTLRELYLFKPDLLLVEWFGVGDPTSGTALLKRYRKLDGSKPPFVYMAGVALGQPVGVFRQRAIECGADGFVPLPRSTNDGEFAEAVAATLERKSKPARRSWTLRTRGVPVRLPMTVQERTPEPPVAENVDAVIDALQHEANRRFRSSRKKDHDV